MLYLEQLNSLSNSSKPKASTIVRTITARHFGSMRCVGNHGKLIITTNGNIVPDMSAFDQAASIAAQYGGNFGQELARMSAQQILGHTPAPPATDASAEETPQAEDNQDGFGDL